MRQQVTHRVSQNLSFPSSAPVTNRCSLFGAQLTPRTGNLCVLCNPAVLLILDISHTWTLLPPATSANFGFLGCRAAVQKRLRSPGTPAELTCKAAQAWCVNLNGASIVDALLQVLWCAGCVACGAIPSRHQGPNSSCDSSSLQAPHRPQFLSRSTQNNVQPCLLTSS